MGLGTNHSTVTTAANFIPEMWENETIAAYKRQVVLGNLVTKINFKGKKGDTLHIPVPARGAASAKAANTEVTFIADTAGVIDVAINKHFHYAKLYEDIADMQAMTSMRKFYTDDAGYTLAKQIDQDLHLLGALANGGALSGTGTTSYEKAVIGGDGSTNFSGATPGNGTALTDAGIRKMIQTLEDQDVNSQELKLILPPVEANVLRGIARFTEQAFVGDGSTIKTGRLGNLYGVEVYISSNCPWVHVDSGTSTQFVSFSSTTPTTGTDALGETVTISGTIAKYRAGLMLHKDAICHAEQMGIRTQSQYILQWLGEGVVSDTIYGVKELRDYASLAVIVPA
ncbi:MAG: capsid protein [Candidatus Giovannonibacteria bacterium GW2011_GWA2_44_26]|uniref:Capsid protein n=1 Tax=Candidatus Giovannonibacteria bacterium GW2011_GWA2_44_26 TaxID=1618648 RepID=A0A0G1IQV9_9BACT|nr:MAG: capsid protein [Candidatus Giovannonibacteria bacterium GW2011_GWA2_44_26]